MKSCINCAHLVFPKEVGSPIVMKCKAGEWEWDSIEEGSPMTASRSWQGCPKWELRIEELHGKKEG